MFAQTELNLLGSKCAAVNASRILFDSERLQAEVRCVDQCVLGQARRREVDWLMKPLFEEKSRVLDTLAELWEGDRQMEVYGSQESCQEGCERSEEQTVLGKGG